MTLEGWVKEYIESRYPSCFDFDGPENGPELLVVDMMQWIKGAMPGDYIKNERQMVGYFRNKISKLFDTGAQVVVICFDKASPEVKKMVCHTKRYERRCKQCQTHGGELPRGRTASMEYFDPNCQKQCINKQIMWREEGPHLHVDTSHPIDPDWSKFCSDSRNLLHELYPRIANALLEWMPPRAGQMLFVDGLPFKQRQVYEYENMFDSKGFTNSKKMRVILEPWSLEGDLPLPLDTPIFDKVYVIENCGNVASRREVPEMQNDIHEADNAIFFFSRFFPDRFKQMVYINDGDAISIGLLRVLEDFRGPGRYAHEQWLCLPYKSKKKKALFTGVAPTVQYVNLTKLCQKVEETPEFVRAGVQSPVATMVFLIILSETDFFKGEFCFGIGGQTKPHKDEEKRERQTKGVWDTFFGELEMFSHLVQYYPNVKSLTEERRIVLDEELFRIFTQHCYINKYGVAASKKHKHQESTYDLIKLHCKSMKDTRKHPPEDHVILRWARQITWNLNYWANAFRNIYIDPFEEYNNQSYYGYRPDMTITNVVATKQKPLDEVYKRNFWKRKQKPGEVPMEPIADKKKQAALNLIRGK